MLRVFAGGIAVLLCASCAGPRPDLTLGLSPDEFARFAENDVVLLETPSPYATSIEEEIAYPHMTGTAFRIGRDVFVTARHVLDKGDVVYHNQKRLQIKVLVEGSGVCMNPLRDAYDPASHRLSDDWIVYQVVTADTPDCDPPLFEVDFDYLPEHGDVAYLVGFPLTGETTSSRLAHGPSIKTAKVVSPPYWMSADHIAMVGDADRLIGLKLTEKRSLQGMSGGPALVRNEDRFLIVGMFVGVLDWKVWWAPAWRVRAAVRPYSGAERGTGID